MSEFETTYNVESKTYAALFHTAWHLLDEAEQHVRGRSLNLQAAIVFYAFAFEAYLNHVGEQELTFWNEIDRISHVRKLRVLSKHLGFPTGTRPFQTVSTLFELRNALAHGRTQNLTIKKKGKPSTDRDEAFRLLPWEQLSVSVVKQQQDDVSAAIEAINAARPQPDDMLWNQGGRGYGVQLAKP